MCAGPVLPCSRRLFGVQVLTYADALRGLGYEHLRLLIAIPGAERMFVL